jgi:feruloyl esterase
VIPPNALELLKQWTDIHGLPLSSSLKTVVDAYPREIWVTQAGEEVIESYTIRNMAHGVPLAVDGSEQACGAPGPFLLPVGISSTYHISKFFGFTPTASSRDLAERCARPGGRALEGEILSPGEGEDPRAKHLGNIAAVINDALRAAGLISG